MNGPEADGYWKAMELELQTPESKEFESWEVVPRSQAPKILGSTWAFKCKRFPVFQAEQ